MKVNEIKKIVDSWAEDTTEGFRRAVENTERAVVNQKRHIEDTIKNINNLDKSKGYYYDRLASMCGDMKGYVQDLHDDEKLVEIARPILEKKEREDKLSKEAEKPEFSVLKDFVEVWKKDAIDYYKNLLNNGYDGKDKDILYLLDKGEDYIVKLYEYEAKMRLYNMVEMVIDKTGDVVSCRLYNQPNNGKFGFEGTITGEKGMVSIQAILAGGYNIQKLHVRVLINLIK